MKRSEFEKSKKSLLEEYKKGSINLYEYKCQLAFLEGAYKEDKVLTFEQFRDSKERMNLAQASEITSVEEDYEMFLIYDSRYHIIELVPSEMYMVVIGRCDFKSKHLDELEAKLWLFICEEYGYYEEEIKIRNKYQIFEESWYF